MGRNRGGSQTKTNKVKSLVAVRLKSQCRRLACKVTGENIMRAEILATGDEIRSGALIDSNSAHIAQRLEEHGVEVARHLSVGDDIDILVDVMHEIADRADVAVVTGGLGPTQDDLSAEAAAKALGVPLEPDARALTEIESYFVSRGRRMTPSNRKQGYFPRGATVLYNPVGTAPGFSLVIGNCRFFFMPGVPHEMRRMLADQVIPAIQAQQGDQRLYCQKSVISCFGLPESEVGERLDEVTGLFAPLKLGLRAKFPEIQVRLYLNSNDATAGQRTLAEASQWVVERLGPNAFSTQERSMAEETGLLLKQRQATVATAESCTGGLVAHWLTNTSGSSEYFLGSVVAYANEVKIKVLGVAPDAMAQFGAVHEETARQMAVGARLAAGADYGIATSGIAGPTGGTPEKPVGTLCVGLAGPQGSRGWCLTFGYGSRLMFKQIFAMAALDSLRRHLLGILAL